MQITSHNPAVGYDLVSIDPSVLKRVVFDKEVAGVQGTSVKLTQKNRVLEFKGPATHAGMKNFNGKLYIPSRMKKAASTFLEPYSKPVLLSHDSKQDAVGRCTSVAYIPTPHPDFKTLRDASNLSHPKYFELLDKMIEAGLIHDPSFQGLGYIMITAEITDKEAIEKVLDERHLTMSISTPTDRLICPICKLTIIDPFAKAFIAPDKEQEGNQEQATCEHGLFHRFPDGKEGFVIFDNLRYTELSLVNIPADQFAVIEEVRVLGEDSTSQVTSRVYQGQVTPYVLSITDTTILGAKKEVQMSDEKEGTELGQEARPAFAFDKLTDQSTADEIYDGMSAILDEMLVAGEVQADAKLTAEQREKLRGSQFCGPNRSFPVPDCAHVTAARRLIGRASLSQEQKDKILSCVARKAKVLGCEKSKADSLFDELTANLDDFSDFDIAKLADCLVHACLKRGISVSELDTVASTNTAMASVRAENDDLKKRMSAVDQLYQVANKQVATLTSTLHERSARLAALIAVFDGQGSDLDAILGHHMSLSLDELEVACERLVKDQQLRVHVNTYLSGRKPSTLTVEDSPVIPVQKQQEQLDPLASKIASKYTRLASQDGEIAKQWLYSMHKQGYIDQATLEQILNPQPTGDRQ